MLLSLEEVWVLSQRSHVFSLGPMVAMLGVWYSALFRIWGTVGGPYVNHCLSTPSSFVGFSSFDLSVLNNPPALNFAVHKLRSIGTSNLVWVCSLLIENMFFHIKCSDQGFFPLFHLLTDVSHLHIHPTHYSHSLYL